MFILDYVHLIFFPPESSMGEVKNNPIELSRLEISMKLHGFCIDSMQNCCPHVFELCQIRFCPAVLFLQGICPRSDAKHIQHWRNCCGSKFRWEWPMRGYATNRRSRGKWQRGCCRSRSHWQAPRRRRSSRMLCADEYCPTHLSPSLPASTSSLMKIAGKPSAARCSCLPSAAEHSADGVFSTAPPPPPFVASSSGEAPSMVRMRASPWRRRRWWWSGGGSDSRINLCARQRRWHGEWEWLLFDYATRGDGRETCGPSNSGWLAMPCHIAMQSKSPGKETTQCLYFYHR